MCAITTKSMDALDICYKTRDTRYRDKRRCHQSMWSAQHRRFPTSDIRKKKKCYSRGYAIARCQAKTTLKSYWHELRDHQEYRKKIAMKTGTHTQVPVPMTTLVPIGVACANEPLGAACLLRVQTHSEPSHVSLCPSLVQVADEADTAAVMLLKFL